MVVLDAQEKGQVPVATEFALVEDFADQLEVLVFFVSGLRRGGSSGLRGRRGDRLGLWYCHVGFWRLFVLGGGRIGSNWRAEGV